VLQDRELLLQAVSLFCDGWVFSENISQVLVVVDFVVKVELNLILATSTLDKEMTNSLRHSISDVSDHKSEVMVDSLSKFVNKDVLRSVLLVRNDVSSVHEIVVIIGEEVTLLRFNNVVENLFSHIPLFLKNLANNFKDLSYKSRESCENSVGNFFSQILKVEIDVLKTIHCRVFDAIKAMFKEIIENIN